MLVFSIIKGFIFSGFGKFFNFISKNWKWVLPLIVAIILIFTLKHLYDKAIDTAYKSGVAAEQTRIKEEIKKEDALNRKVEVIISDGITKWTKNNTIEDRSRIEKEVKRLSTVKEIIRENPVYNNCKVTPDLVDQRNAIRKLGPNLGDEN